MLPILPHQTRLETVPSTSLLYALGFMCHPLSTAQSHVLVCTIEIHANCLPVTSFAGLQISTWSRFAGQVSGRGRLLCTQAPGAPLQYLQYLFWAGKSALWWDMLSSALGQPPPVLSVNNEVFSSAPMQSDLRSCSDDKTRLHQLARNIQASNISSEIVCVHHVWI